jgi:hypothetical protein
VNVLLPLLIVAMAPDVPIDARYPEAVTVFHCTFDKSWDENFDGWPDRWTRRRGRGFPHYVNIKIDQQPSPQGDRSLRIDLDGGAAVAYSPPIKVDPLFGYVLEGYLRTEGLTDDRAYFSVTLLDEQRQRLETFYSEKVRQAPGWTKLRLGPLSPGSDDARLAIIGLHVQPGAPTGTEAQLWSRWSGEDLKGAASFDDIWLGRLPRLALNTTGAYNFFDQAEPVEINCVVSGLVDPQTGPRITFQLEDVLGRELAQVERILHTPPPDGRQEASPAGSSDGHSEGPEKRPSDGGAAQIAKTIWQPPIPGPGFYRVRATMEGRRGLVLRRELSLAVFDQQQIPSGGEFGWTLPRGDQPLPLPLLSRLVGQAGINWLKYPLQYDQRLGDEPIEQLVTFGEQLAQQGIELVGLLHQPPSPQPPEEGLAESLSAADVFTADPKTWYPSLEPVISRMATRVRWWQLGDDKDTSFVDCPNLAGRIAPVKAELDRIGRDVNLGIGWGWMHELPQAPAGTAPWRFLTLSANPPLTHHELATYLDASQPSKPQRWVVIEPLPKDRYPVEVRATDLLRRMVAAKIHGADAVFCPDPFGNQRGLLSDDGTPGELLFTWRTVARTLGGAQYLGSLQLPRGSPNQIFTRGDDVVMVVWNDEPTEEILYLGEDVRQIDLWGHSVRPAEQEHRQVIRVGPLPTLVTGIHEPITRWRLDFALAEQRIPSISNRPHPDSFRLTNHFARAVVGRATLVAPQSWRLDPRQTNFWLDDGEPFEQGFEITLPPNASSGRQPIRVDFELEAERSYRFSVYRHLDVGLGDVYIEIVSRLNEQGELEVEQRLVNRSDGPVSFRCQLFARQRRRQATQVIALRPGRDAQLYRLADGKELLGQTLWLRADEIGGPRVLNYRFQPER